MHVDTEVDAATGSTILPPTVLLKAIEAVNEVDWSLFLTGLGNVEKKEVRMYSSSAANQLV